MFRGKPYEPRPRWWGRSLRCTPVRDDVDIPPRSQGAGSQMCDRVFDAAVVTDDEQWPQAGRWLAQLPATTTPPRG